MPGGMPGMPGGMPSTPEGLAAAGLPGMTPEQIAAMQAQFGMQKQPARTVKSAKQKAKAAKKRKQARKARKKRKG